MTVRVNKPSFNIREKLTELGRRFGLKGSELAAAETIQEARDLVSAGRKNLVINGDMRIAQRGTSANAPNSGNIGTVDRWNTWINYNSGVVLMSQENDSPPGFHKSLKFARNDSSSPSQYFFVGQKIEAQNLSQLEIGTSSAKSLTISFWVKSNRPGTYNLEALDDDGSHQLVKQYKINNSGVWEYKSITFPPNTVGGVPTYDNTLGIEFNWWLSSNANTTYTSGSLTDNWASYATNRRNVGGNPILDTGQYWMISGVQLEVGRNATDFEHRSYGEELALCQRYFYGWNATSSTSRAETGIKVYDFEGNSSVNQTTTIGTGSVVDTDDARIEFSFPVTMRTKPTPTVGDIRLAVGSTLYNSSTTVQYDNSTTHHFSALIDNGGTMTAGQAAILIIKGNGYFYLDAEL